LRLISLMGLARGSDICSRVEMLGLIILLGYSIPSDNRLMGKNVPSEKVCVSRIKVVRKKMSDRKNSLIVDVRRNNLSKR
jgi:hypothetical protein